jgi:hypothetical protein
VVLTHRARFVRPPLDTAIDPPSCCFSTWRIDRPACLGGLLRRRTTENPRSGAAAAAVAALVTQPIDVLKTRQMTRAVPPRDAAEGGVMGERGDGVAADGGVGDSDVGMLGALAAIARAEGAAALFRGAARGAARTYGSRLFTTKQ